MVMHNRAQNGQAQTASLLLLAGQTIELVKHLLFIERINSRPLIQDLYTRPASFAGLQAQGHHGVRRGILQGIFQRIAQSHQ